MNVIIALESGEPVEETLRRLADLGFLPSRVIGHMVIGSAPDGRLASLKADPAVKSVEADMPLKPLG